MRANKFAACYGFTLWKYTNIQHELTRVFGDSFICNWNFPMNRTFSFQSFFFSWAFMLSSRLLFLLCVCIRNHKLHTFPTFDFFFLESRERESVCCVGCKYRASLRCTAAPFVVNERNLPLKKRERKMEISFKSTIYFSYLDFYFLW